MAKHKGYEGMFGVDPAMKTGNEQAMDLNENPSVEKIGEGKNRSGNVDLPTSPHGTKKRGQLESDY